MFAAHTQKYAAEVATTVWTQRNRPKSIKKSRLCSTYKPQLE